VNARWPRLSYPLFAAATLLAAVGLAPGFAAQGERRDQAVAALYSPNPSVRLGAVDELAQVGTAADADLVIEMLYDSDPEVRAHAQAAVWALWGRSGDPEIDRLLQAGIERLEGGEVGQAVEDFTRITERKPEFAEGWNKRATAYYLMGDFARSLKDCDEVIKRNPQHFGALSGYGMIYFRLGDLDQALRYFERAFEINPNLKGVEESIRIIRQELRRGGRQDI